MNRFCFFGSYFLFLIRSIFSFHLTFVVIVSYRGIPLHPSSRQSVKQSVTSHLHDVRSYSNSNIEQKHFAYIKSEFSKYRGWSRNEDLTSSSYYSFFTHTHTTHTPIHTSVHIAFESFSSCEEYTEETCEHHQTYSFWKITLLNQIPNHADC